MTDLSSKIFLLDTNVFLEAYKRYYAMDLCPGFWECLEHYCQEGRLLSIDRVRDEISEGDRLDAWIKQAPTDLFASTANEEVAWAFGDMVRWVQSNGQFRQDAKDEFARSADGWLVAYAAVHEYIVVTHEGPHPDAHRRVPIPNICHQYDVPYENPFEMLRELGVSFSWR